MKNYVHGPNISLFTT